MTPDELPADMEAVVSEWLDMADEAEACRLGLRSVVICQTEIDYLRALLKAYQEQRRALEAASPVVPVGVSREDEAWSLAMGIPAFNDLPAQFQQDIYDAILAALRPTDTGRE